MLQMLCSTETKLALKTIPERVTYKRIEEMVNTDASTSFEQRNIQARGIGRSRRSAGW